MEDRADENLERFGNPWWGFLYFAFVLVVFFSFLIMGISGVSTKSGDSQSLKVLTAISLFFCDAVILVVIVFLATTFSTSVWRAIYLSPSILRLPMRNWREVPISEITGVGLAQYAGPFAGRSGTWSPVFWRSDGSHVRVMAFGLYARARSFRKDPAGTRASMIVATIYNRIVLIQGPDGPLARIAQQKTPGTSDSGYYVGKVWDPSQIDKWT
jgi:hypothetical protein